MEEMVSSATLLASARVVCTSLVNFWGKGDNGYKRFFLCGMNTKKIHKNQTAQLNFFEALRMLGFAYGLAAHLVIITVNL